MEGSRFIIDKGVPIPSSKKSKTRKSKYPFRDMKIGDSFSVPVGENGSTHAQVRLSAAACNAGRQHGMKFTTRKDGDAVRVWRIA